MANKLRECMLVWEEEPGSGRWSVLAFDGVMRESHSGAVQVTSYPVDSGFVVSDHAIRQNRIITLDTITSNISMSVATSRKTFEESFNELMVSIGAAQNNGAPVYEAGEVFDNDELENAGPSYTEATKYGRPAYDNDSIDIDVPYTSITLGTITNPFLTALLAEVSLEKVDETVDIIDRLNGLGQMVHLICLRGVRKNCVIRSYETSNDVSNSYSAPVSLVLEQLNVVDLTRSTIQTSTNFADGEVVAQEQGAVRQVQPNTNTFAQDTNRLAPQTLLPEMAVMARMAGPVLLQNAMAEDEPEAPVPKDIVPAEFYELEHREIPYSTGFDTRFIYKGVEYTLGRVRYNEVMETWVTALQWRENGNYRTVASLPLISGTNLVQQYATNMPSLVAVNISQRYSDPTAPANLRLYIIDQFNETFLRS